MGYASRGNAEEHGNLLENRFVNYHAVDDSAAIAFGMTRKILLFVCCLAGCIVAVYIRQPVADPVVPEENEGTPTVVESVAILSNAPAATPEAKTVSVPTDPVLSPATETATVDAPVFDEKEQKAKDEMLRQLSQWAMRDPESALAATME